MNFIRPFRHLFRWAATALLTIGIVFATGCVAPPRTEPELKAIADDTLGLGAMAVPAVDRQWWRDYGDPQFDTLVEAALAQNPTLQQMSARVRSAQAQLQFANGQVMPHTELNAQEQWQRFSEKYIIPPPFGGKTYWVGDILGSLSWDLDLWGRQSSLIDQARASVNATGLDAAAARLAVTVALSQAYLDLNRATQLAEVAQASVTQRQKILEITSRRISAGLDTSVELREAESAVPQAELARLQSEAARELAVHRLAAITGSGAGAYERMQRPTLNLQAALTIPDTLPADLLGRRPDVLAARARVTATTAGRAAARAAFYPNINLSAFAGFQAIGLDNLLSSSSLVYGGGPAISLPLFESIRLKSAFNAATAAEDESIASYNDVVVRAVQQVADQLSLVKSSALQLEQARSSLGAAEEAYRLAQKRYEAGLANYLSVLTTETQVLNARVTYVDVQHQQALSRVSLLLAAGGSFDPAAP